MNPSAHQNGWVFWFFAGDYDVEAGDAQTQFVWEMCIRDRIKPSPVLQARTRNHRLRVAAYCRVSTEQEEQQTSIENQIIYYEDLIRSNPEWEYAGVFSDDGISGTRDENRPGFMEMIKPVSYTHLNRLPSATPCWIPCSKTISLYATRASGSARPTPT